MADIVTTRIFQDGEKNITATKLNDIVASSTIQPAFVSSKPSTSTIATTDNLLVLQTAGTYAKAPFQTVIDSVNAGLNTDTEIWKVRLRSFNSLGNSTFEVSQPALGSVSNPANGSKLLDRWYFFQPASVTGRVSAGQAGQGTPGIAYVPGTNFRISNYCLAVTLNTQQTTLAAGDALALNQSVEGIQFRELSQDVHSISLLVYTNVAGGLKFGVGLRDSSAAVSLTKLCTIPTANAWTLISLPNIPVWSGGGSYPLTPGNLAYSFWITLAAGTNLTSPAADTWQATGSIAPPGIDNFMAKPVNSTFYCAFVQHEPGAVCSTPMDCPFTQNYDSCLRYFCKSYDYAVAPGAVAGTGIVTLVNPNAGNTAFGGHVPFPKPMAKAPTVTIYNHSTGAANSMVAPGAGNVTVSSVANTGQRAFAQVLISSGTGVAVGPAYCHYTADTGW